MQKLSLSVELINAVLGYLGTRPFVDVANLINSIHEEAKGQLPEPEIEESSDA
jgi:hypothetical protein